MTARRLIQIVPTEILLEIVGRLTNGRVDPQFVRAAVVNIKRQMDETYPELGKSNGVTLAEIIGAEHDARG